MVLITPSSMNGGCHANHVIPWANAKYVTTEITVNAKNIIKPLNAMFATDMYRSVESFESICSYSLLANVISRFYQFSLEVRSHYNYICKYFCSQKFKFYTVTR